MTTPLFESTLRSLTLLGRGKVRDIYAIDADKLLIVTSDRLSAFDVILPDPIPRKGEVLTAMAGFWFARLGHIVPNQLTGIDPETVVAADEREQVTALDREADALEGAHLAVVERARDVDGGEDGGGVGRCHRTATKAPSPGNAGSCGWISHRSAAHMPVVTVCSVAVPVASTTVTADVPSG